MLLKQICFNFLSVTVNWEHDITKNTTHIRNLSCHSDVSVFAVAFAVAVPENPVVAITGIGSESSQQHCMVGITAAPRVVVDAGLVVLESRKRSVDADSQWTDGYDELLQEN